MSRVVFTRDQAARLNLIQDMIREKNTVRPVKRSKYGNTKVDGFDSKKEKARFKDLELMEKAGEIRKIEFHKVFPLEVNGELVCRYEADFVYEKFATDLDEKNYDGYVTAIDDNGYWYRVVEDVKSPATRRKREYRIKNKLFKAIYGFAITEV